MKEMKKCYSGLDYLTCDEVVPCIYRIANKLQEQFKRKKEELRNICKAFDIEYIIDKETGSIIARCNKLNKKEQECEKLKKQVRGLRPELKSIIDKICCKYNIEAKNYHERIIEIINNLDEYKQTLTEIKEIAEKQCNICEALTSIDEYKDCKKCWQGVILQKISECEEEERIENNKND